VAFYYSLNADDDDLHIQKHGVAVLSTQGDLQVVLDAEQAVATPRHSSSTKDIPIGWSRSGRFIYYTNGVAAPREYGSDHPSAVFRFDFEAGQTTRIASGIFVDVAPDDEYILCRPVPTRNEPSTTTQIMLSSGEIKPLPQALVLPRISPSGRFAVDAVRRRHPDPSRIPDVQFYSTADWQPVGEPIWLIRINLQHNT
jgi:hypothetical protein